jgi:hypothetical protein
MPDSVAHHNALRKVFSGAQSAGKWGCQIVSFAPKRVLRNSGRFISFVINVKVFFLLLSLLQSISRKQR